MNIQGSDLFCLIFKISFIILYIIGIILLGRYPYKKDYRIQKPVFISLANAFTIGSYIAISLIILIPDSQYQINEYLKENFNQQQQKELQFLEDVPWGLILISIGYIFCVLIDKIALNKYQNKAFEYLALVDAMNDLPQDEKAVFNNILDQEYINQQTDTLKTNNKDNYYVSSSDNKKTFAQQKKTFSHMPLDQSQNLEESFLQKQQQLKIKNKYNNHNQSFAPQNNYKIQREHLDSFASSVYDFQHNEMHHKNTEDLQQSLDQNSYFKKSKKLKKKSYQYQQFGVLIVYVMYSVGEGLVIGINEKIPQLIFITLIVFTRKAAEMLHFSVYLKVDNASSDTHNQFIIIYSMMLPLGVCMGWVINSLDDKISGFFVGVVTGFYLYICTSYLLIEEFQFTKYQKWTKFFLTFSGLCLSIGLVITQKGIEDREF